MTETKTPNLRKEEPVGPASEWEVIHTYTRSEALSDGVLVPVCEKLSREAGLKVPVALTSSVHASYVKVPEGVSGQDETGRLWDILWMTRMAILSKRESTQVPVTLYVRNDNTSAKLVTLRAEIGPDDFGNPVITVMMPGED